MNHDDLSLTFLGVGVQLLPVLWIVLAIETTWLRTVLRTTQSRGHRAVIRYSVIIVGAVAEALGVVGLANGYRVVVVLAVYLLQIALLSSITLAAMGLWNTLGPPAGPSKPSPEERS